MGLFSGMAETTASTQKGAYLTEGDYTLNIQRVAMVTSKKNSKTYFVVDFKVVTASNSMREGALASWLCKMGGDWPQYALADIKAFAMAATGADGEDIDEQFMEDLLDNDGAALNGVEVACSVTEVETKRGGSFSKHRFAQADDA